MIYDVVLIGGGVIGATLARELTRYRLSVLVVEKENDVACGASKANSGIVHGGYDPEPGTLKAKLNVEGVEKLYRTADELHVPYRRNGSLVCAFCQDEEQHLRYLYERGQTNGVKGMSLLTGEEARGIEPLLSSEITAALLIPSAGIICPYELTIAAMGNAIDNGAGLLCNFSVASLAVDNGIFRLTSEKGEEVSARYLVNCAGGYSDQIAAMAGDTSFTILPRSGEYLLLDKSEGERVSHTIFQVPTKEGKGILVSPTVDGNLLTGPTATLVASPSHTETTARGIETVMRLAKKSVPSLNFRQVITSFSGVRSSEKNGDFIIEESKLIPHMIHVAAIDSPGLTSCIAIAEYVRDLLAKCGLSLSLNPDFDPIREDPHAFRHMNEEEKNAWIRRHPAYGKIVCRCEGISEGEIRDALRREPKPSDLDGIKRRTRSGMGRCQGGFCSPYVMKLLAEETGMPKDKITKNGESSEILIGKL